MPNIFGICSIELLNFNVNPYYKQHSNDELYISCAICVRPLCSFFRQ